MALRDNLISWWSLDEASGTRVDSHGSNDLSDNNTVGAGTAKLGDNAADFEADNSEYLSITDANQTGLSGNNAFSMQFWVNVESAPGTYTLASKWDTDNADQEFSAFYRDLSGTKTIQADFADDSGNQTQASYAVDLGTSSYKHVVITWDVGNQDIKIYVDNTEGASMDSTNASAISAGTGEFQLGARTTSLNYDGLMDEVAYWSRELTASEVSELYNSGDGLSYADTAAVTRRVFNIT